MTAELLTALGAIAVGVAAILNAILANRKSAQQINDRLDGIERRLDSHNHYAEMYSESSERIAKIETDVSWIKTALTTTAKGDGHN